jgi:signal transduction histidine kinase
VLTVSNASLRGVDVDRARSRALLGALAAELGHDLQGPLNLFRLTTERVARGETLDAEDAELLQEELARLSRMSSRLRQLTGHGGEKVGTTPLHVLQVACAAANVGPETPCFTLDTTAGAAHELTCDPPAIGLALAELMQNALEARRLSAGVRFSSGDELGYCVWDDGPGFAIDFQQALAWGVSNKSGRLGLGLTLAWRIARAHGFSLEHRQKSGLTEVWLLIPPRELQAVVAKVPP